VCSSDLLIKREIELLALSPGPQESPKSRGGASEHGLQLLRSFSICSHTLSPWSKFYYLGQLLDVLYCEACVRDHRAPFTNRKTAAVARVPQFFKGVVAIGRRSKLVRCEARRRFLVRRNVVDKRE